MKHGAPARNETPVTGSRTVLFLQGLATPFYAVLGQRLADDGHLVHRVHYCGGDWAFRGKDHKRIRHHKFTDGPDQLADFYRTLISDEAIDTIVLFGDCRPIHETAVDVAKSLDIQVYALDEGYIRPGFITMEAGGTNGHSRMPHTAGGIRKLAAEAPRLDAAPPALVATDMGRRVWMDLAAHGANILMRPTFRHYRGHRPASVLKEAGGWIGRGIRGLRFGKLNDTTVARFESTERPFFLIPLQLNSDYQIRRHSRFSGMPEFIDEVLTSFAQHADKGCELFFKNHPLDNGIIDYRHLISARAQNLGITDRVGFAAGGDLMALLARCEGAVLVNSTVGFAALKVGTPMKVLGQALYNIDGLTCQAPLDSFWQNPQSPQQTLADEFLTVVETYTQVRGDLFSKAGIAQAAKGAADVIAGKSPRLPAA